MAELSSTQVYGDLNVSGEIKANKLDTATGEGLSDTNFTQAEKTKLAGIDSGATTNTVVQVTGTSTTSLMSQKAVTDALDTKAASSHNHTSLSGTVRFTGSTGNSYNNSNIMVDGNGTANTIKPSIGFHQPGLYAGTLSQLDGNTFQFIKQDGNAATVANNISGNADTATKLQTARTIGGVSFDGSANIDLPGVNAAGNQNTSGNAATASSATKLATARTITLSGDVSGSTTFDGSANKTITCTVGDNSHTHSSSTITSITSTVAANATAGIAAGAVGSYALLVRAATDSPIYPGSTYAGSVLRYSGFLSRASNTSSGYYVVPFETPSGTWRAMGSAVTTTDSGTFNRGTLFLRIS